MTQDQFTAFAASLIRHLLTLGAGLLVARGLTGYADMVSNLTAAVAVFGATLAWSFIQKRSVLAKLVAGLNISALEQLLQQTIDLKQQGADPLLVAHMAGTALAVAQGELNQFPSASAGPSETAAAVPAPAPPGAAASPDATVTQEPDVQGEAL